MAQFLKDEVKDKIKASAVAVFTEKGYTNASIKAIASHAGVSVGNVYRYFDNKEALYSAVIEGVYKGVTNLMNQVEASEIYQRVHMEDDMAMMATEAHKPLLKFIDLYHREKPVFDMLLNNGVDAYYEETILRFIDLLKGYFTKFWGRDSGIGMTDAEVSALTNALVFSVIDMLQRLDVDEMDQLSDFIGTLIQGYFTIRKKGSRLG